MFILDYFSRDTHRRAKSIFNLIAPFYFLIDNSLDKHYDELIEELAMVIDVENMTVLDVGSGTGSWANKFVKKKAKSVTGIDLSSKMVKIASDKYPEIDFSIGDIEALRKIPDKSFDIITSSFMLHGMKSKERLVFLYEMNRITKKHVVLNDFMGKTPFFTSFIELLEKSDYKNFKIKIIEELLTYFATTKQIQSKNGIGLYINEKKM